MWMISKTTVLLHPNLLIVPFVWYVSEYCFTSLSAQSWQYRDRRSPKQGLCPTLISHDFKGFFIVHSAIGSTVHSRLLNSLDHCICTTTMTNILPYLNSSLVLPGYKPQSIRMSHRGRPYCLVCYHLA